ncbi:response regulator [Thiomicrorhabdus sp. 6S2-11]|uniref:histidine kinase n=1 Tax=Thiomicrorhabdus marina TaxID=2818442 RepID=A0ABS3Q5E3_9GAMM|nr:ATP-binding protein [Thiomicrorhabdus marina]MBO1927539.1 response regulator [Thiomicrorhabdus marina]
MYKTHIINSLSLLILVLLIWVFGWINYQNYSQIQAQKNWQLYLHKFQAGLNVYDALLSEQLAIQGLSSGNRDKINQISEKSNAEKLHRNLKVLDVEFEWKPIHQDVLEEVQFSREDFLSCLENTSSDCRSNYDLFSLAIDEASIQLVNELQSASSQANFDPFVNELYLFIIRLNDWQTNLQKLAASLSLYSHNPSDPDWEIIKNYLFVLSKTSILIQPSANLTAEYPELTDGMLRVAQDLQQLRQIALPLKQRQTPYKKASYAVDKVVLPSELNQLQVYPQNLRDQLFRQLVQKSDDLYNEGIRYSFGVIALSLFMLLLMLASIFSIRKHAILPLRQNEVLLAHAPVGILQIDLKQNINMINNQALQMFGYSLKEIQEQPLRKLSPLLADFLKTVNKEPVFSKEITGIKHNGNAFPIELSAVEIGEGNERLSLLLLSDLTEKHNAKVLENKQKDLVEILKDATETTLAQVVDIQVIWEGFLQQMQNLIGANCCFVVEVLDQDNPHFKILAKVPPHHDKNNESESSSYVKGHEKFYIELFKKSPLLMLSEFPEISVLFDEVFPEDVPGSEKIIVPIHHSEVLVGFFGVDLVVGDIEVTQSYLERFKTTFSVMISHEIYNKRQQTLIDALNCQTEEAIRAKDNAEAAAKAKSRFLANMSHEIRTPMNAVLGMLHLLKLTDLTKTQSDYVQKSQRAGESLMGIINDILDFSKIDSGNLELEEVAFDLETLLLNQMELIAESNQKSKLAFILDFDAPDFERGGQWIVGDALRLQQVITNLLSNAAKFTEYGSVKLAVQGSKKNGRAEFSFAVRDTGIGISPEAQTRLFQQFTQADESTTRKYGGTGLGLAISQQIIQLMGGEIILKSELGKGSTFSFDIGFPVQNSNVEKPDVDTANKHVLMFGELLVQSSVVASYLKRKGVRVTRLDLADVFTLDFDSLELFDGIFIELSKGLESPESFENARDVLTFMRETQRQIMSKTYLLNCGIEDIVNLITEFDLAGQIHCLTTPSQLLHEWLLNSGEEIKQNSALTNFDLQGKSVLLVEDNPINQQVAMELLHSQGMLVEVADNGQHALDVIHSHPDNYFDVVLMDLQMPVMGGHDATIRLREESRYNSLPIIALSAHAFQEEIDRSMAIGINDFITKPVLPEALYQTIGKVIGAAQNNSLG